MGFPSFADLRAAVDAAGGVLTVTMRELRLTLGRERLGRHVRHRLGRELLGAGLGCFPPELPESQDARARLFVLGSPVADLIEAVLTPEAAYDRRLLQAAGRTSVMVEVAALVDEVRALLEGAGPPR